MPTNLEQHGAVKSELKEYQADLNPSDRRRQLMLQCFLTDFFKKLQESKQRDPQDEN